MIEELARLRDDDFAGGCRGESATEPASGITEPASRIHRRWVITAMVLDTGRSAVHLGGRTGTTGDHWGPLGTTGMNGDEWG